MQEISYHKQCTIHDRHSRYLPLDSSEEEKNKNSEWIKERCAYCVADEKGEVYPGCPCSHEEVEEAPYNCFCKRCGYRVVSQ